MDGAGGRVQPAELRFDRAGCEGGTACLTVTGEIDMSTGDEFRATLAHALDEPELRCLLLDVAPLRFMDSNAVGVLVQTWRAAEARGIGFGIVNARGGVRSVLEMLGVYHVLAANPTDRAD